MNILITTTFNKNLTEAKIKPLVLLPEIECIYYVSDKPGPYFEKVIYYCVPAGFQKFFRSNSFIRAAYKFFIVLYLSLVKRPGLLMGYSLVPHGVTVAIIGIMLGIPFGINVIGGVLSVEKGGFTRGNNRFLSFIEKMLFRVLKRSNFITVTGSFTKNYLISHGVDTNKIIVLPSSVDTKRFFPGFKEKKYDLITVAELIPRKRVDVFLRIVSKLTRLNFMIKAVVLGDGPLRKKLEDLSERLALTDVVEFAGFDSEVEEYLRSARIFLLSTEHEGLSLAMLEAMACGVIPVVSDVDDLGNAVKDCINGRLIPKDDIDAFVNAASELLKNPDMLEVFSKKAIDTVRKDYSLCVAERKWKDILVNIERDKDAISWYFRRLRSMSILEISYRIRCFLRLRLLRFEFFISNNKGFKCNPERKIKFFIDREDIDFIKPQFLGTEYLDLVGIEDINWHIDPVSNFRFGTSFVSDLKRRAGGCKAEIKKIWDSNRFQWLVGYAQRYALEKNEGLAQEIVDRLKVWIETNLFLKSINWIDSLEISLRLLSWSYIYFLIKDSKAFNSRGFEKSFLKSVYFQISCVESRLSAYSSANNHLIGEAVGLFVTGLLFPGLKDADKRLNKGKAILEKEILKQVYPDGVTKEQSTGYHTFITDLYLLAVIIGRRNGIEFSEETLIRLEKMCEFLKHAMAGGNILPSIGDSDDGVAIKLNIFNKTQNALSVLRIASILFNRPDFKKGDTIDEKTLWLLGKNGYEKYISLKTKNETLISSCFKQGGYYLIGHGDIFVSFDCGELGYLSLGAHGHADSLSITLNVKGKQIFVDPGTYLYHSENRWRDYFRSTRAHNTVTVDMIDQSEIKGPFLWGHKAKSFLKYWSPNGGYDRVCGYHTGYSRLKDPVIHEREVMLDKFNQQLTLRDSLISKGRHFAEIYFHLHPDCTTKVLSNNKLEITNGNARVFISLDHSLATRIYNGSEIPICGWYSEVFGEKVKTSTICSSAYFEENTDFVTRIWIGRSL